MVKYMEKFALQSLFSLLKIKPKDIQLYEQALTHSSYAHERNSGKKAHNERLEFLGDAVLELAISEELFCRYPKLPEGKLTRYRAVLVCEEALVKVANFLRIGELLRLGKGEAASGGRRRPSLLADAFEALLGAIYLDLGLNQVKAVVKELFAPLFKELAKGTLLHDYKTLLQEYTQGKFSLTPEYSIISEKGPDHDKTFVAQITIKQKVFGTGSGRTKKEAEQEAARLAYELLVKN